MRASPAGPRGAAVSWAAMKPASPLTSAACAGYFEMTHPSGRFPAAPGWYRPGQSRSAAGSTPAACVPRVRQDRGDAQQAGGLRERDIGNDVHDERPRRLSLAMGHFTMGFHPA